MEQRGRPVIECDQENDMVSESGGDTGQLVVEGDGLVMESRQTVGDWGQIPRGRRGVESDLEEMIGWQRLAVGAINEVFGIRPDNRPLVASSKVGLVIKDLIQELLANRQVDPRPDAFVDKQRWQGIAKYLLSPAWVEIERVLVIGVDSENIKIEVLVSELLREVKRTRTEEEVIFVGGDRQAKLAVEMEKGNQEDWQIVVSGFAEGRGEIFDSGLVVEADIGDEFDWARTWFTWPKRDGSGVNGKYLQISQRGEGLVKEEAVPLKWVSEVKLTADVKRRLLAKVKMDGVIRANSGKSVAGTAGTMVTVLMGRRLDNLKMSEVAKWLAIEADPRWEEATLAQLYGDDKYYIQASLETIRNANRLVLGKAGKAGLDLTRMFLINDEEGVPRQLFVSL